MQVNKLKIFRIKDANSKDVIHFSIVAEYLVFLLDVSLM